MKKTYYCYHAYYEVHIACHKVVGTYFAESSNLKNLLKDVYDSFSHCCRIIVFDDALDDYCEVTNRDSNFIRETFEDEYSLDVADGYYDENIDNGRNHEWFEFGDIDSELDSTFDKN